MKLTPCQATKVVLQVEGRLIRNSLDAKRRKALAWLADRHVLHPNSVYSPRHPPVLK